MAGWMRPIGKIFTSPSSSYKVLQRYFSKFTEKAAFGLETPIRTDASNTLKLPKEQSVIDKIKEKFEKIFKKPKSFDMTPDPIEGEFNSDGKAFDKDTKQ